jgi:hypothetical protein
MRGTMAVVLALLIVGLGGCSRSTTPPASSAMNDPIAQVLSSHHVDAALVARCSTASGAPSDAILATARSTVGAVRASMIAHYRLAHVPKSVNTFPGAEAVVLCALDGKKFPPSAEPPLRSAVMVIGPNSNSWWAAFSPA